jgi:hypothetical protein
MPSFEFIRFTVAVQSVVLGLRQHLTDRWVPDEERGEGVISAAIAVLIMAVIGAAMFLAYKQLFDDTNTAVNNQVKTISG